MIQFAHVSSSQKKNACAHCRRERVESVRGEGDRDMRSEKEKKNIVVIDLEINKSVFSGCGEEPRCGLQVLYVNSL